MSGTSLMRFGFVAALFVVAFPVESGAQTMTRYAVRDKAGKTVGMFECGHVTREEGVFASSAFYKGAKAVESKKGMKPLVRSYAEMQSDMTVEKYKRWKEVGSNTRESIIFKFGKDIKKRVSTGESAAKVSVMGKLKPVYLIEPDQPHLAALLLSKEHPEKTVACINTDLDKIAEATVKLVGTEKVDAPAPAAATEGEGAEAKQEPAVSELLHWKVTGGCGELDIWQTTSGRSVKFASGDHVWESLK